MSSNNNNHMSVDEYKEYLCGQSCKNTKFKNKTCYFDGLYFQSQKELNDYLDQKRLLRSGKIAGFLWQGSLVLVEGGNNKENRAVTYRPDIVVFNNDGTYEIREVKGKRTKDYIIKKKIVMDKFKELIFKEV